MYVVMRDPFDSETDTVWGPFSTATAAKKWIEGQPDRYNLYFHRVKNPNTQTEDK